MNTALATYTPSRTQKQFHNSEAKRRLLIGDNQSGKTLSGAFEAAKWQYQRNTVLVLSQNERASAYCLKRLEQFIGDVETATWIDKHRGIAESVTIRNGATYLFATNFSYEKVCGVPLAAMWVDEPVEQAAFEESAARLIDQNGPLWWSTYSVPFPIRGTWEVFNLSRLRNEMIE